MTRFPDQFAPLAAQPSITSCTRRSALGLAALLALPARLSAESAASGWKTLATEVYKGKQDDLSALPGGELAWYGNGAGKLFATRDGGESWEKLWDRPGTFIRALGFVDAENGFLGNVGTGYYPGVTDQNPLYRTRDGGISWTPVPVSGFPANGGICAIHILPQRRIFQGETRNVPVIHAAGRVGGPAFVLRSEDGGESWRTIDLSAQARMILDVHFHDAQHGLIAASTSAEVEKGQALILRTRDGGNSWQTAYRGARAFENIWKMSFPTPLVGYATVQSYDESNPVRLVIKTTDGGASWQEIALTQVPGTRTFGIGFADAEHGWVGTRACGFETRDGGQSWTRVDAMGPAVNKIRIVEHGGGKRVFAIGQQVSRLDLT
jgi:photosystem II stability/assembly factor-like uncharacterized protein